MRINGFVRLDLASLLLLGFSICLVLVAGEFAVRYTQAAWPFEKEVVNMQNLPPNELHLRWHFFPENRRQEFQFKGQADSFCRILFLGDSVTLGLRMDAIEGHLAEKTNTTRNAASLIKMANSGHTTYQELEFLRVIGLKTRPDLVLLGFVLNDVYYKYLHRPTGSKLLDAEPSRRLHRFDTNTFPGRLVANSYLAHEVVFGSQILWKRLSGIPRFPFERRDDAYLAWKSYGWDKTRELLGEMKELVGKSGARLEVIIFPTIYQANETYRRLDEQYVLYPIQTVRHILEQTEIPYLDLTESIYTNGGVTVFKDWVHFNDVGREIVAKKIAEYVALRLDSGVCENVNKSYVSDIHPGLLAD